MDLGMWPLVVATSGILSARKGKKVDVLVDTPVNAFRLFSKRF